MLTNEANSEGSEDEESQKTSKSHRKTPKKHYKSSSEELHTRHNLEHLDSKITAMLTTLNNRRYVSDLPSAPMHSSMRMPMNVSIHASMREPVCVSTGGMVSASRSHALVKEHQQWLRQFTARHADLLN